MQTIQELINKGLSAVSDGHVCICQNDKPVTALELKEDACAIAASLYENGALAQDAVAVYTDDRIMTIKGMTGVLKAACVFVPIEGDYPLEMVRDMLEIAKVKFILADDNCLENAKNLAGDGIKVLPLESILSHKAESAGVWKDDIAYSPEDPIYVYFTSGTTGKPKAILGKNKSLVHFIEWESRKIGKIGVNVSQITSPCHDPFLRDIFTALNLQGKICIPSDKNVILDGRRLAQWVKEAEINVLHCTPSIVNHMLSGITGQKDYSDLNYVFMAGEKISPKLLKKWYELTSGDANLVSLYGPTETTLAKMCYDIKREDYDADIVPLGRPIDDTDVYICSENLGTVTPGEEGEIVISTEYTTFGYLNNDELNAKLFSRDESNPVRTMYRTGDLGRVKPDGNIEFLGRKDSQIKIRGNRVELNYIESLILQMASVKECILTFNDENLGKEYIAAYVVADKSCSKADIIDWLKTKVPGYMFPAYIVFMDELPLNKNMKVDRKRLPDPTAVTETKEEALSDTETKLVEACKEILDTDTVLSSDNFFALGGSSLNVMTLISRIYDDFKVEISLEEIFDSFSLADLAAVIDEKTGNCVRVDDLGDAAFTRFDYLEKKNAGYVYDVTADKPSNVIGGMTPFNDIFYRSCVYNSIFSVVHHFGAGILPILANDIVLYRAADKLTMYEKLDFIEEKSVESVLKDVGVDLKCRDVKENVIQNIISAIDAGKPVILGVDCFYESIRPDFYMKENWPHNILVYGYDNENQEVIVMEHTGINNLDYHEQRLSYLDLEYAYQSIRIKFPNAEEGRHYMECAQTAGSENESAEEFFETYKERIQAHLSDIRTNLDGLPNLLEYIENNVADGDSGEVRDAKTWIARLLDAIVEAKKAQSYLLEKIDLPDDAQKSAADGVMIKILKKWKYVRNALYKCIYSGEYDSELMRDAISGLDDIKELENKFYDNVVCL